MEIYDRASLSLVVSNSVLLPLALSIIASNSWTCMRNRFSRSNCFASSWGLGVRALGRRRIFEIII
jgi:hypothetical protein